MSDVRSSEPVPVTVVIADDEPVARDILRIRLEREDGIEVIGEAEDGPGAVELVRTRLPDVVFLDIQMPGFDGFEVLSRLERAEVPLPYVVFVTAFDEYALRAFDVHALDYLLKPFDQERLTRTLERVRRRQVDPEGEDGRLRALLELRRQEQVEGSGVLPSGDSPWLKRLIVRDADRFRLLHADDIDWIESAGNYVRIHTGRRTYLLRSTTTELERSLDPDRFVRIHRSTIVHLDRVTEICPEGYGDYTVLLTTGETLRMSRTYRSRLLP